MTTEQFAPQMVGVWISDEVVRARPGAMYFHGRIAMMTARPGFLRRPTASDVQGEDLLQREEDEISPLYTHIELGGRIATVALDHIFDAPSSAKVGDAYQPELDAAGDDTTGEACGEGYNVEFSGMCPVQGEGAIDGYPCYYRARGKAWRLEVYEPGGSVMKSDAIWRTGHVCYVWPEAGYLRTELSVKNIERAVSEFRKWKNQEVT